MTLRRAATEVAGTAAEPLVAEAVHHLEHGLAELREFARGLHPSSLGERGLAHETAIYSTGSEALTNVAKYADATRVRVSVAIEDGHATAQIADDGCGGADAVGGSGLRGLADRLEAIGGSFELESPAGGGTVVRARVPLAPAVQGTVP
jgi:signal transduction histidine kinase